MMIRSLAAGLLLSIALQACAHRVVESAPAAVAVVIRDTPPAELLACPQRPAGFPEDAIASLPKAVREAAIRLAHGYAEAIDQLERLIAWHGVENCGGPDAQG